MNSTAESDGPRRMNEFRACLLRFVDRNVVMEAVCGISERHRWSRNGAETKANGFKDPRMETSINFDCQIIEQRGCYAPTIVYFPIYIPISIIIVLYMYIIDQSQHEAEFSSHFTTPGL